MKWTWHAPRFSLVVTLAELAASVAVVLSVLFLAVEYRRAHVLTNREVENILYANMREMDRLIIENPDLALLVVRSVTAGDSLAEPDRLRYVAYEHIFFDSWESAWNYHRDGTLDDVNWQGWDEWFLAEARKKPLLAWQGNRKNYAGEFRGYLDGLLGASK